MDRGLVLALVGTALTAYSAYLQRKQLLASQPSKNKPPKPVRAKLVTWWRSPGIAVMAVLALLCWWPYFSKHFFNITQSRDAAFYDASAVTHWGADVGILVVVADGERVFNYQDRFRLVAAVLAWDGRADYKDTEFFAKSPAYEITKAKMPIPMPEHKGQKLPDALNFFLYLVPKVEGADKFSTPRQAGAMGCKILWQATAEDY